MKQCPVDGVDASQIKACIALTFYMGLVKKDIIKTYWSTDDIMITLFCHNVMSHDRLQNFLKFLHNR